jgi:hypothetical protein
MDYLKLHLLATVILTQSASVWSGDVPYFPIEISRTASSSALPLLVFRTGVAIVPVTLWFTRTISSVRLPIVLAWIGLAMIAGFDDVKWMKMHVAGIVVLILASVFAMLDKKGDGALFILTALLIYAIRIPLKIGAVAWYEFDQLPMGNIWALVKLLVGRHMEIMFKGPGACRDPIHVMPIFKICAVLQWVAFYALSFIF